MADSEERAALSGLGEILFKLVSKGATKAQWAEWLRAPLEHALADGDKSLALTLLAAGADGGAGWEGCNGRTLLGAAAEGGSHEAVSAVLEAGGLGELDFVAGDKDMTALHRAIAGGHPQAALELMLAGADVGLLDSRGRSALHYAVDGGYLQLAGNALLAGADFAASDTAGDTPLHLAAAHDDKAFVTTLLRRGASVSATNNKGQRPLQVAVKHGRLGVAEALLKAGANPNKIYKDTISPLYLAVSNLAMTRSLLKHGADVNWPNRGTGFTTLHHCAGGGGQAGVVEVIVEAGGNVGAQCGLIGLRRLEGLVCRLTPLHVAALYCNLGAMSMLLRRGADANAVDWKRQTPLHLLCRNAGWAGQRKKGIAPVADLLLRWGADEKLTDSYGRTPEQAIKPLTFTRPLRKVLANAPVDRAWRRRGMLVMCRAFPNKVSMDATERAGKAKASRRRGHEGGGTSSGRDGEEGVLARVVELENDEIFRMIVGFL